MHSNTSHRKQQAGAINRSVSLASKSHSQIVRLDFALSLAMTAWQRQTSANVGHYQQYYRRRIGIPSKLTLGRFRAYVSTRVSAVQMQHAVDAVNTFILRMYQELCMFGRSEPAFVFILRFYNIPATARTTRSLYTALDYYQFNRCAGVLNSVFASRLLPELELEHQAVRFEGIEESVSAYADFEWQRMQHSPNFNNRIKQVCQPQEREQIRATLARSFPELRRTFIFYSFGANIAQRGTCTFGRSEFTAWVTDMGLVRPKNGFSLSHLQTFFTRAMKDVDVVTSIREKGSAEVQHNDEQLNIDYYQFAELVVYLAIAKYYDQSKDENKTVIDSLDKFIALYVRSNPAFPSTENEALYRMQRLYLPRVDRILWRHIDVLKRVYSALRKGPEICESQEVEASEQSSSNCVPTTTDTDRLTLHQWMDFVELLEIPDPHLTPHIAMYIFVESHQRDLDHRGSSTNLVVTLRLIDFMEALVRLADVSSVLPISKKQMNTLGARDVTDFLCRIHTYIGNDKALQLMKRLAVAKKSNKSQHQSVTNGTVLDVGSPGQRLRWLIRLIEEKVNQHTRFNNT